MKNHKLKGIRGWLLLYIILSISSLANFLILMPLIILLEKDKINTIFNYPFIEIPLTILSILFTIVSLIYIIKKKKKAITSNIILLEYAVFSNIIYLFYLKEYPYNLANIPAIIIGILWIIYWHKSKRVKNTFVK